MYSDLNTTNNNLSQKFAAKDISNGSLNQITTTGFYFGSNITEVTPYIKSHKWCLINAYVSGNSASIFVIAGDAMALSIYRNGDGVYSYYPIATKSDLEVTEEFLLSTPTEYLSDVNTSDRAVAYRSGNTITLILNMKTLKALTAFTKYLILPEKYRPTYTLFSPVVGSDGQGIRIGADGAVMVCKAANAGVNIQTTISYVRKS